MENVTTWQSVEENINTTKHIHVLQYTMTAYKADFLCLQGYKNHSAICQVYIHKRPKQNRALCYGQLNMLVASTKIGEVTNIVKMTHLLKKNKFWQVPASTQLTYPYTVLLGHNSKH
jgi:hypothetical protein